MKNFSSTNLFTVLGFLSAVITTGNGYTQESESDYLTWAELKTALTPSYTVYDSTGHPVGVTTNGKYVEAAFPAHQGVKFRFIVTNDGTQPRPDSIGAIILFLEPPLSGCTGNSYVRFDEFSSTALDGVTQLRSLVLMSDHSLRYGDYTLSPSPIEPKSYYSGLSSACLSTLGTPYANVDAIPTKKLVVNWKLPLSARRQQ